MKDTKIIINGSERWTGAKTISYADVVRLAWMRGPAFGNYPTVVYHGPQHGDARREGTMYHGCPDIELEDGIVFDVTYVDNR